MTEKPILFSAPMVRAILAGTKSQTRRVITSHKKAAPYFVIYADRDGGNHRPVYSDDGERGCYTDAQGYDVEEQMHCPYGAPGDRLWVRETWMQFSPLGELPGGIGYRADLDECGQVPIPFDGEGCCRTPKDPWRPSIHMPRWASRITLEVTGVRVERLQDISEADAHAEGVAMHDDGKFTNYLSPTGYAGNAVSSYRSLWDSINGAEAWAANPWVWVVEFRRVTP